MHDVLTCCLQEHGLVRAVPPPAGSRDKLFVYKALNKGENKNIVVPEEIKPNPQVRACDVFGSVMCVL